MTISIHDVQHIATLARLGLTDDRARALVVELNGILVHMDALSQVNTETTCRQPLERMYFSNSQPKPTVEECARISASSPCPCPAMVVPLS